MSDPFVQDLPTVLSPGQEDAESSRWEEDTRVTVLQTDDTMDPTMEETEEGSEPEANSEVIGDETPQAESTTVEGEADPSVPLNSEQNDSAEADQNHTNSVKKPSKAKLKKVTLQRTTAALHNRMRRSFAIIIIIIITNIIIGVDVILLLLKVLLHACCRRRQRRGWQRSLG